ncbi:hypothetical protein HT136_23735 [Novosphingobium profundi]|uniref:hypothetical protein n=1 Tax=Novosphingobium profundi TaxID=1774954 RepID=UPI001BDA2BF6|nr:hypothetical protein [Novosphingobium profundi]MBT0671386.1 hypothetical protein [Novosphingobium profundi]
MSFMATLTSILAILCCLFLVSGHSGFRQLGFAKSLRLGLIWAVIIVGLVLVIQVSGLQIR